MKLFENTAPVVHKTSPVPQVLGLSAVSLVGKIRQEALLLRSLVLGQGEEGTLIHFCLTRDTTFLPIGGYAARLSYNEAAGSPRARR